MEFYWDIVDNNTILLYEENYDYPLIQAHLEEYEAEEYYYVNGLVNDFENYELIVEMDEFNSIKELQKIIIEDLSDFIIGEIIFWQDTLEGLNDI